MKKNILFAIMLISSVAFAQERCIDAFPDGLQNVYEVSDYHSFENNMSYYIKLTSDELRQRYYNTKSSFSIPLPIGKGLINLSSSNGYTRKRYDQIRNSVINSGFQSLSTEDKTWIYKKTFDEKALDAWLKCMEIKYSSKSLSHEVINIDNSTFRVILRYVPKDKFQPEYYTIDDIDFHNCTPIGGVRFQVDAEIEQYTGISQRFKRDPKNKTNIQIHVSGMTDINISLEPSETEKHATINPNSLIGNWRIEDIEGTPPKFRGENSIVNGQKYHPSWIKWQYWSFQQIGNDYFIHRAWGGPRGSSVTVHMNSFDIVGDEIHINKNLYGTNTKIVENKEKIYFVNDILVIEGDGYKVFLLNEKNVKKPQGFKF